MAIKSIQSKSKLPNRSRKAVHSSKKTATKKADSPKRLTGFTHSLNWSGSVPSDLIGHKRAGETHELIHRVTFVYRDPDSDPLSVKTVFEVDYEISAEDVAEAFDNAFDSEEIEVRQGAYPNKHRVEFNIPASVVGIVHTIESRNYGDGALVPNKPTVSNRLNVLKSADETVILRVWTESIP